MRAFAIFILCILSYSAYAACTTEILTNTIDDDCDGWINREDMAIKAFHPRLFAYGDTQAETQVNLDWVASQLEAGVFSFAYNKMLACRTDANCVRYGAGEIRSMFRTLVNETYKAEILAWAKDKSKKDCLHANSSVYRDWCPTYSQALLMLSLFDWHRESWTDAETRQLMDYFHGVIVRDQGTDRAVSNNHFQEDHAWIRILPGIVFAGESLNLTGEEWLLGRSEYWMIDNVIPMHEAYSGDYGACLEGNGYWGRGYPSIGVLEMAWSSATDDNLFEDWSWNEFPKALLYFWRPSDGKLIPLGNEQARIGVVNEPSNDYRTGGGWKWTFLVTLPIMRWANSPEAAYIYKTIEHIPDYMNGYSLSEGYGDSYSKYLLADAFGGPRYNPAPVDLNSLNRSAFFRGYDAVVIREGWSNLDTIFTYKQNRLTAGHDHMDAGSFTITKGASLAIDAGYYSSNGDIMDDHTRYFYPRTIAHNTITVFKPGQVVDVQWWNQLRSIPNDDGGQRGFGNPGAYDAPFTYADMQEEKYSRGEILRYESKPEYTYFQGDVTDAYFSDSVSSFTRSVVSFDGDRFIMLDRVSSTDASYPKRWLMHSINKPVSVDGSEKGSLGGGATAYGGTEFYVENGPGRLFVKMLLPVNTESLLFRGGSGFEYWSNYDSSGKNGVPRRAPTTIEEPGSWRVEEKIVGETDSVFLNVLFSTDKTVTTIGDADKLASSPSVIAAKVGNRVVAFSRAETLFQGSYSVPGAYENYIFDLTPGAGYTVKKDGADYLFVVASPAGVASFTSVAGEFSIGANPIDDLLVAIERWKRGEITITSLLDAIRVWKES